MVSSSAFPRLIRRLLLALLIAPPAVGVAWGGDGHTAITEAAVELLPGDFPPFVKTPAARARLSYLADEPDRWRNLELAPMGQLNKPDHYLDVDLLALYELDPKAMPPFRYDYITAIELYKAKHPEKDFGYNPAKDADKSKEYPGFAPYRICELYVQLKSSWRTLNTYEKHRAAVNEETQGIARENIVYLMGLLSHYVGDMSQPLHATKHFNGWVGENPKAYTTDRGIHALIDDGVIDTARIDCGGLMKHAPTRRTVDEKRLFDEVMAYILDTFAQVEPLYELEQRGAFKKGSPHFAEGVMFLEQRMAAGAVMLAALWDSASRDAGIDEYRERALRKKP